MKAKSKVLLGLLIALAMMVFAVPAFAAGDMTFEISNPTPSEDAKRVVYVGDKGATAFTFDVSDTNGAATDTYTVAIEDVTANLDADEKLALTADPANITGTKQTVAFKTAETGVAATVKLGTHNMRCTVQKTAGDGTGTQTKDVSVIVKEMPTAKLTGDTAGAKTVEAGNQIGLNVVDVTPADATSKTYQWQIADSDTEAADVDSEDWKDIEGAGAKKSTIETEATVDMNGKYVRCVVDVDGKKIVAKTEAEDSAVQLTVTDSKEITVTVKDETDPTKPVDAKASYTFLEGYTSGLVLDASAVGGAGDLTFKWQKDGKDVPEDVADVSLDGKTLTFDPISEDTQGKYQCVVTDETDPKPLTGKSLEITVNVTKTPTLKIAEADGKPSDYATPTTHNNRNGEIFLTTEDLKKDLTLTAETTEMTPVGYTWYKNAQIIYGANNQTYTIKAADLKPGDIYSVQVGFNQTGLTDGLEFFAQIKETSGSLAGGLTTSIDGGKTLDRNPTYTVTLPAGLKFKEELSPATATFGALATAGGVKIDPFATDTELKNKTVQVLSVHNAETATDQSTMTFVHQSFGNNPVTKPIVADMKVTVTDVTSVDPDKVPVPEDDTVNLPVSSANGYQIKVPATAGDVKITDPKYDQTTDTNVTDYTGEPVEAKVEAKNKSEGVGEISNIRYQLKKDGEDPDASKATKTAPKDAGEYYVFCDIAASDSYGKADNVQLETQLEISPITLSDATPEEIEANGQYFVMTPASAVYDGKPHTPEVDFADDVTHAGKIKSVKFYDKKDGAQVDQPISVGKYDVKVEIENDPADNSGIRNIVNTEEPVSIGTFEITKVEPTPDLYEMKPTEVTYTGAEQEPAIAKADDKAGDVAKVIYYADGSDEPLEGKPVEAGVYTVTIETKESDTYAAATGEDALELGTFTIKPEKTDEQPTIYINPHVENIGWAKESSELKAGESIDAGTTGQGLRVEAVAFIVPEDYKVVGFAHVQNEGDVDVKKVESSSDYDIPEGYVAYEFGSTGKGQRVEAVCIGLQDADGEYVKGFQYATHLQNYGWQGYVRNGSFSGTRGMALRMESIRFTYADPDVVKPGEPSGSLLR